MTITDLLDRYGVDYAVPGSSPHVRPGWIGVVCCFCGRGSSNYGLGFNLAKRFWTCWKCGPKKGADVLVELLRVTDREASTLSRMVTGDDVRAEALPRATGRYTPPPRLGPLLKPHRDYLRSRRLDPDELEKTWELKGIGLGSSGLSWRIFVPVHLDREPVSWTTRAVNKKSKLRYLSAAPAHEAVPHKEVLYGADLVKHTVVVHEGPADVWATGPGATCTFGTNYTKAQVVQIARFPVRYVCFDAEPKAQEVARRLCDELAVFPGTTHNVLLETGKDSCDASDRERKQLRDLLR